MILTHGANSLERGDFVEIGGRRYPVVKIGNQLWMAENLDYADENITVGGDLSTSEPKAYYYDQNETLNGPNGRKINLLYNTQALLYLVTNSNDIFPDGWHIPSDSDVDILVQVVGTNPGIKLSKGNLSWQSVSWNGTDDYGFSWLPGGTRWGSDGRFATIGEEACFWSSSNNMHYTLGDGQVLKEPKPSDGGFGGSAENIRLVKDAT